MHLSARDPRVALDVAAIFQNGRRWLKLLNLKAISLCEFLLADSSPSSNSVGVQQLCKGLLSVFTNPCGWSGV